jgi:uncharacterized heparinase superfamily protein
MNIISKYYHSVKYLKYYQTIGRAYAYAKRRFGLYRLPKVPDNISGQLNHKIKFLEKDPLNTRRGILNGEFNFAEEKNRLGYPINWDADKMTPACELCIHFFNFLYLLNKEEQIEICKDWIKNHPVGKVPGWDPYALALRIMSWMRANLTDNVIDRSIYEQASFLYRNNEFYIPANHYLENARSLVAAGLYFNKKGESKKWLRKGLKILLEGLRTQFHDDAGHYEKSIMYHNICTQIYLDAINMLPNEFKEKEYFKDQAVGMISFLDAALHPDGKIALFSDSSMEMGNDPKLVINFAEKLFISRSPSKLSFPSTGYFTFKNETFYFILDAGEIGPDHMPGHSHADIFSYELSVGKNRFIVDSGVSSYADDNYRRFQRSTRAHNTVCIDKKDQAEMWGSFRVARRFKPNNVSFLTNHNGFTFSGKFKGYSKLIGDNLVHNRKIECSFNELTFIDSVEGKNNHLIESLIHLHPDVKITIIENGFNLSIGSEHLDLIIEQGEASIEKAFYSPQMGLNIENNVIVIAYNGKMPTKLRYKLIINK